MRRSNQKGFIASLEFCLGFFLLWLVLMAWVEISYMSFISATNDLIIAEAAGDSKIREGEYGSTFTDIVEKHTSGWEGVLDRSKYKLSIQYLGSVSALESYTGRCSGSSSVATCGNAANSSIAIYHLTYDFSTIFSKLFDVTSLLKREVIVIQEYERDAFEIDI